MPLRPYQTKAIAAIRKNYEAGVNRQLLCMSTGSGKTEVFAHIPSELKEILPGKMLVLVNRDELAKQAYRKLVQRNPNLKVGIEAGNLYAPEDCDLIVSSVQTLGRLNSVRVHKLDLKAIDKWIVDEAHHGITDSYQRVYEAAGLFKEDSKKLLLGVTATPVRGDGQGLNTVYQKIVYNYDLRTAIEEGYLVDVKGFRVDTETSLDDVHTKGGDYDQQELADTVDNPTRNRLVAESYQTTCKGRQAIGFGVNIEHSRNLAKEFQSKGIKAEAVWGTDPERHDKIDRFKKGLIQVLFNAQLLCLDTETEILTDQGWVRYNEMTLNHKVANWSTTGKVFFKEPTQIVVRPLDSSEHMVSIESRTINLRVTNTHRMLIRSGTNKNIWTKIAAQDLLNHHVLPTNGVAEPSIVEFDFPQSLYSSRRVAGNAFTLRQRTGIDHISSLKEAKIREIHRNSLQVKHPSELTLDECRLIGFWVADGSRCAGKIRGGIEYTLVQSTTYPRIIEWIDTVLQRLDLHFIRYNNSDYPVPHIKWSLCRGTGGGKLLRKGLFSIEPYLDKNGSKLLWGLNESQFDALVEGYWYGDGHHGKAEHGFPRSVCFNDTKKSWIDLLCAIGAVRGWRCAVKFLPSKNIKHKDQWYLRMIKKMNSCISQKTNIIHETYKPELVWCVNTETKNIITRRNGKVTVMGNTEGFDMPSISCVILAAPTKSGVVFSQRVGRGTRLFEGKTDCIILDLVDSTTRHNLITLPTLLGLPSGMNLRGRGLVESAKLVEEKLKQEPRIDVNKILDMDKLDSYVEEVDLFAVHLPSDVEKNSTFTWFPSYDGGYRLLLPNKDEVKITKNLLDKFEICGKLKDKKYRGERSSLSEAFSAADELVTKYAPDYLKVVRQVETWHNELPTEKQLKHLKKIYKGKELPATLNRGEAHKLLSAHWAGKEDKRRKPAWLKSRKSNLT